MPTGRRALGLIAGLAALVLAPFAAEARSGQLPAIELPGVDEPVQLERPGSSLRWAIAGGYGWRGRASAGLPGPFSLDAEFGSFADRVAPFTQTGLNDPRHAVHNLLISLCWRPEISRHIQPYLGGGAGGAFIRAERFMPGSGINRVSGTALAQHAVAGLRMQAAPRARIDLDYRYVATGGLQDQALLPERFVPRIHSATVNFAIDL